MQVSYVQRVITGKKSSDRRCMIPLYKGYGLSSTFHCVLFQKVTLINTHLNIVVGSTHEYSKVVYRSIGCTLYMYIYFILLRV